MKVLGINDDVTTCEACGKSNLKKTVVLETADLGVVHYGSDCAARAIYGSKAKRGLVDNAARAMDYARRWIASRPLEAIANVVRVHWCHATVENGRLLVNGVEVR